jgi:sialic acid synthase SpsE/mannose-6-phosphate isomerase-like protein (cupin superfamily)
MPAFPYSNLFILEMANNHMGDLNHGLTIIRKFHEAVKDFPFTFAIKFQYRHLDTFIHPDYKDRQDIKYVKRFQETRLSADAFLTLKTEAKRLGFLTACTPFDERSVDLIEEQGFDLIKIASCSFTDWPLLERIVKTNLPVVASTAGVPTDDIDRVVSFLEHRDKALCLMHCVGSYPTPNSQLELNQLDFFRERYAGVAIGFSTHEEPENTNAIKIAAAKGATAFERHIGIPTPSAPNNPYSSTPEQLRAWLSSVQETLVMCGVKNQRRAISEKEAADLIGLKRGVFARKALPAGTRLTLEETFLAIPNIPGQLLANDLSKYMEYTLIKPVEENVPILRDNLQIIDHRALILEIVKKLATLLKDSKVTLRNKLTLELSHHYGIDKFERWGCSIINCINREYCKKIILLLPGQENPCHAHKLKEETFHILYGTLQLTLDGKTQTCQAGDIITVERGQPHSFSSPTGAIFEEVSTTHYKNDSYYEDRSIELNTNRKTEMTFWADWLKKSIS